MESQRDVSTGTQRISPPAAPVQQEFLFVEAAKAKCSRQGRRNARSFVMQKARKERPWSTSKYATKQRKTPETASPTTAGARTPNLSHTPIASTPSPPLAYAGGNYFSFADPKDFAVIKQEVCPECQILLCRLGQSLCPKCLVLQSMVPAEDPDISLFDPFGTTSVEVNGSVSQLLEHYVTEMAPGIIAVDIRNKSDLMSSHWFDTAKRNSGFMHSLLCTAALHRYFVGSGSVETILYHRAKAIIAVNTALSHTDTNVRLSDANIGAVFNLLTVEESLGSSFWDQARLDHDHSNQRETHLKGLRSMVHLRGGLMAIKTNRILQAFILWHSTAHAIATFDAPYLSTSDVSAACNPRHPPGYRPNKSRHLINCGRRLQVTETLTAMVESLLILVADLNVLFGHRDSPLDPLDIQNYACVLECMLLKWLRDNEHHVSPLEDALCVALLIFTIRTTEALKRRSDIHTLHFAASQRLEKALSATKRSEWQSCPELLLWILAIGAVSAEGSDGSYWFAHQTSLACIEFDIHSADALLEKLHLCGWVSFKLDEAVYRLWERMINIRLEPFIQDSDISMAGPLQNNVASPDYTDWQNVDWSAFSPTSGNTFVSPGGYSSTPAVGGDEFLYDLTPGYRISHNESFPLR